MMNMAQQMKHMASLPTLASVLCHIATIAVVMHGRTGDLGTAPRVVGGSHRNLESTEPPHDPLVSIQLQLHALSSRVQSLVEDVQEIRENRRMPRPKPEPEHEAAWALNTTSRQALNTTRRQAQQGAASNCDASGVCTARIITRTVVMQSAVGTGASTAPHRGRRAQRTSCDFASQSAAVMVACCVATSGGHRRAQADCPLPEICPSARCAQVFQPFYDSCTADLEATPELGTGLAALYASCNELQGGSSLAHQLNLQCTGASVSAEECIPTCNVDYHGYMMLLNINGDDSKFSCNLAHGLYGTYPLPSLSCLLCKVYTNLPCSKFFV